MIKYSHKFALFLVKTPIFWQKYLKNHNIVPRLNLFTNDSHIEMKRPLQNNGAWINYNCDHVMSVVCETVAGIEPPTTAPPPTDTPDVECHEGQSDGWIKRPGNFERPGGNPMTFEFTATTPAL
jgi:hypothetical protein